MTITSLRRSLAAGLAIATLAVLAACAAPADDHRPADSPGADSAAFPVTIEHALGTATIEREPSRVITLGQGATEAAIAVGVYPVGTETYPWGADADGHLPWVRGAYEAAGMPLPTVFTGGEQLDIEAIAELEPDLILAPWSGLTQEQHDLLAQLAPTVAYERAPWTTTWDGEIRAVARALGRVDAGEQAIADVDADLAAAAAAHPQYAGRTFSYVYTQGPGTLGVYMPTEQRVAMIEKLGLTLDPVIDELRPDDGSDWSLIGLEHADRLSDSDLVFTWYLDEGSRAQTLAQPLYASIPAVARGSVVAPDDPQLVTAMSMISPLTIAWSLERLTPLIDDAIAQLPA